MNILVCDYYTLFMLGLFKVTIYVFFPHVNKFILRVQVIFKKNK